MATTELELPEPETPAIVVNQPVVSEPDAQAENITTYQLIDPNVTTLLAEFRSKIFPLYFAHCVN